MQLIKNIKNRIKLIVGIAFVVGTLTGSYITKHDNSLSVLLLNQRTNIIIALLTGAISGYVVSLYFDSKQKNLESREFIRLFISYLTIFKRGITDFLECGTPSVFEQYPIGENAFSVSFDKYEGYISEEIKPLIKNAIEIVNQSKLSYSIIKTYSKSNDDSLIRKEEYKKNVYLSKQSKDELDDKIDNTIKITTEKDILSDNVKKIQDLIFKIHEQSNNS